MTRQTRASGREGGGREGGRGEGGREGGGREGGRGREGERQRDRETERQREYRNRMDLTVFLAGSQIQGHTINIDICAHIFVLFCSFPST